MKLVLIILTIIFYSSVVKSETVFDKSWCSEITLKVYGKYYRNIIMTKNIVSVLKKRKSKDGKLSSYDEEELKHNQEILNKFENSDWLYKTATIYNAFCKK